MLQHLFTASSTVLAKREDCWKVRLSINFDWLHSSVSFGRQSGYSREMIGGAAAAQKRLIALCSAIRHIFVIPGLKAPEVQEDYSP